MKPTRCLVRCLLAVIVFVVLYGIAGFLVLPRVVKAQVEKRLSAQLGRTVSVGQTRVNPFMLSVSLENLEMKEKDSPRSFLGWKRLYVRFDALRSLAGAWVLGAIEIDGFHASVIVNADGTFNFADVAAKLSQPSVQPAKPGRPVRICSLKVVDSRVEYSDLSLTAPFSVVVGPLTFDLSEFRSTGGAGAPYHLEGTTDSGERLSMQGTLSTGPFQSSGGFEGTNLVVRKYSPYLEKAVKAHATDGLLTLRGRYQINGDPKKRSFELSEAELHVRGLRIEEQNGKALLDLGTLDLTGAQVDATRGTASVGRVALADGHLFLRRDGRGLMNLLNLAPTGPFGAPPAAAVAAPASARAPHFTAGELAASNLNVDFTDEGVPRGSQLAVTGLGFSLRSFTLAQGAAMPVHLSFAWASGGNVRADGTVVVNPDLNVDLKADISSLEVVPLSPYLEQFFKVRITQGALSTSSHVIVSAAKGRASVRVTGDLSIEKFALIDSAQNKELLGFSQLGVLGLEMASAPQFSVLIKQVRFMGPYARLLMKPDRTLNIAALGVAAPSPGVGPSAVPAAGVQSPRIAIGSVMIEGGKMNFLDLSVEPNVHASWEALTGTLSGLSSENQTRADVAVKGMVDGVGPVEISGKVDPLGPHKFVDLKITVRSVDLIPVSPYSAKYAGYEVARGQLVVDSKVLLDGAKLESTSKVTLNHFSFGAATASPFKTGLPVRLALALLKDAEGNVVVDLPVRGSLDDPAFHVGKVILRIVVNLLTKAAVSPFTLIGSMFGGGGEELAFQEFTPGSSELQKSELPKLATMAKALSNRPSLSLGIEGAYDRDADSAALRRRSLDALVRRSVWEARHAADEKSAAPDDFVISADEREATVTKLYDAKFPPGTSLPAPAAPPPRAAAASAAPPRNLILRMADALTFKKLRAQNPVSPPPPGSAPLKGSPAAVAGSDEPSLAEMTGRLEAATGVAPSELDALAGARAQHVRDYLVETGHISKDRLFLEKPRDTTGRSKMPRVMLHLQ